MKVTVELRSDCTAIWAPHKPLCKQWIRAALKAAGFNQDNSVSISLVTEQVSAELNATYRGKNSATNVLSFPAAVPDSVAQALACRPLGDLVICPPVVEREAIQQSKALPAHWAHLTVHGTLHLLGYDHEQGDHEQDAQAGIMEQLEINALRTLGINNPYVSE